MKTNKSTDETKITPSKKKLKQARLPFKLISDVSPTPDAPQTRKRKLSAPETETVSKIGKLSKENDVVEETVIISDDDSKDSSKEQKEDKLMNPYVKLVDAAWKKKQQKSKVTKKKKGGNKRNVTNGSIQQETNDEKISEEVEMMDIDEPNKQENCISEENNANNKSVATDNIIPDNIVVLDASNDSSDVKVKIDVENTDEVIIHKKNECQSDNESPSKCNIDIQCDSKTISESNELLKNHEADEKINQIIDKSSTLNIKTESFVTTDTSVLSSVEDECIVKDNQKEEKSNEDKSIVDENNITSNLLEKTVTPKRSARNKLKMEQNNNANSPPSNSKSNESISSNTSTPQANKKSPASNEEPNESLNESLTSLKNLTPRQVSFNILIFIYANFM